MIVYKLEVEGQLKSAISKTRDRFLGLIKIANIGVTGEKKQRGKYKVSISKFDSEKIWKVGEVKDFPRLSKGPWDLLFLGLLNLVGDRNKKEIKKFLEGENKCIK